MSNFVTLDRRQFEEYLPENFTMVDLPNCKEFVYDVPTVNSEVDVRIYSTVDHRTDKTRRIGSDAIRVVFWDKVNDRPIGKGKKILRVEGATTIGDRIKSRIAEFLESAAYQEVVNFDYAKAVLRHDAVSWMDFANSLLEQLEERGSLTDRQLAYVLGSKNPKGKPTFEGRVISKDKFFREEWINNSSEDDEEVNTEFDFGHNTETAEFYDGDDDYSKAFSDPMYEQEELLPTSGYPHWQYPFENFNPVQTMTMPYKDEDCNLVIGANTSSGKTICAELLMDETLKKGSRVIYLSPLKALTQEKYDDWQKRYPKEEITILTGDYTLSEKMKKKLAVSNIIVMTSEMCDSRTRRMRTEKNFWLKQVGLVIVDESHILSTNRGHAVESGIMRFTAINKKARILFLSATMPNCRELADWLTELNGKKSSVVYSTWRPVELNMNFVEYIPQTYGNGRLNYWATQNDKIQRACGIVMSKPKEKFLVFCHDKGTGRRIVKKLQEEHGIETSFHNADLDLAERLEVESKFQNRDNGGIRVLVSTSTLAWGRNLPARNVVIVGIHRGINEVDELDIIQMAGRAGRYGIDDKGFVFLLTPYGETETWKEKFNNPRPVTSVLDQYLMFHIIAEVETKTIQDPESMIQWFNRSLLHKQGTEIESEKAGHLINSLMEMEMIDGDGYRITPTGLGRTCAWLYFDPKDVYGWFSNFDKVFHGIEGMNDKVLSWAIGDIPSNNWGYIPKDLQEDAQLYMNDIYSNHKIRASEAAIAALALYHSLSGSEEIPAALKAIKRQYIFDIDRINQALSLIDKNYAHWNSEIWGTLPLRVKYGVSEEIVPLTRITQVGGKRAKKLFDKGFTSIESIAKAKIKDLTKVLTPAMAKKIKSNAKQLMS